MDINKIEHYEILEVKEGFVIQHKFLKTLIPGVFTTQDEVTEVLALLLIGNIYEGSGDFVYKKQPMINKLQLDKKLKELDIRPTITPIVSGTINHFWPTLSQVKYEEGLSFIPHSLFTSLKLLETSWVSDSNNAGKVVYDEINKIWQITRNLKLNNLQVNYLYTCEYDESEIILELRECYPELAQLSDDSLLLLYGDYQSDWNHLGSWSVYRENSFVLFVLGKEVSLGHDGFCAISIGIIVAYGLITNLPEDQAIKLGKEWSDYDNELRILTAYIAQVMRFLSQDNQLPTNLPE
jgi:hypothetical protein